MTRPSPSLPSVMNHSFSKVPAPSVNRSVFDRSHGIKTAFDAGLLVPFFVDEVLPGDTVNLSANLLGRIQTLIYPLMDNLFLDTFFFFVPNRILWEHWEAFTGARANPGETPIDYEVPIVAGDPTNFGSLTLADYFGLPTKVNILTADCPTALHFRAYNMIWNEWFRDENLQDFVNVPLDDGPDTPSYYSVLPRGKKHDYFTSCLPFAQKGDDVSIPLTGNVPVIGDGGSLGLQTDSATFFGMATANGTSNAEFRTSGYNVNRGNSTVTGTIAGTRIVGVTSDPDASGLIADLSSVNAVTINELREAIALQHVLEIDARGGTRYVEGLMAHWGVSVPDYRLQRPEYLGGSSQRVNITAVAQTTQVASPTAKDGKGTQAGYGMVGERCGFTKSFVEYGVVIGLVNVRADISYQQGIRKMWNRRTRFDFALPSLAHLGEQAVLQKEIYYPSNYANANVVFGYQERFAEYRYFPSQITGPFRSNYTGTLDAWHLGLNFGSEPVLDGLFIQDAPPLDRVIQVATEPHMLLDGYVHIKHARALPVYAVPGLLRL